MAERTIAPENQPLGKSFEPKEFAQARYEFWEKNGLFEAADESVPGQKAFCIVIPPPNVTGVLHMGHALTNTIQDILVRWHRMKGDNTLWLPGTDHAGIATQTLVEKAIAKEGKGPTGRPLTRHDLGREKFLERTWRWKHEHADQIKNQLKHLGSSLDWSRERFTMDEGLSAAVREIFVRLYDDGLIYRGERIINWCTRCQTALSDLEVIPTDRKGHLYHIQYFIEGVKEPVTIATTRPETLLGDSAIAVHPEDERYKHLHGKKAILPLLGRKIPVITDEYVDREFGSGALKVTPAHDFNDNDLGNKHKLEIITVMGKDGKITAEGGPYAGLKFAEAREKVVEDLKAQNQFVKMEDHPMKVGLCQRCDTVAEPIISKQWFVKIAPLAKPAIEAVETGKIEFSPKSWEKTYFEWMYNIRDWCISRQLWWGHQIPAWYCDQGHITVSRADVAKCGTCSSLTLTRDEDVLDTWFSSGLWPFSTLGWPEKTKALQTFYPTSILETGFDIIFFWVARMIMMGIYVMKDVPFRKVYLHAMVRDEKGQKMSKSKGNVIDPLVLINEHGADPLRFTLAAMAGQGRDIKLSVDRVEGYRAFANKIWNATKFLHMQFDPALGGSPLAEPAGGAEAWLKANFKSLSPSNRWILSRLQKVTTTVEKGFAQFELNESAQGLYEFAWLEFCDWYIEFSKEPIKQGGKSREETLITFSYVLETTFKLLHPIMPLVTEELWLSLPWKKAANSPTRKRDGKPAVLSLMYQTFPTTNPAFVDEEAERTIGGQKTIIEAIRNFRGENGVSPKVSFPVFFATSSKTTIDFIEQYRSSIVGLARISELTQIDAGKSLGKLESVIPLSNPQMDLKVNLDGLVDIAAEKARLQKEISKVEADLEHCRGKLSKESFVAKAPPALLEKERATEAALSKKLEELKATQKKLG